MVIKHSFKWARKLKQFNPKNLSDFTKGRILSWKEFEETRKVHKNKQFITAKGDSFVKENNSVKSILKMYSRNKYKRDPTKDILLNQDVDSLGEFMVSSELNFEGDTHLTSRPNDTSLSSSSDSKEAYLSDNLTEKDMDSQLEGVSL